MCSLALSCPDRTTVCALPFDLPAACEALQIALLNFKVSGGSVGDKAAVLEASRALANTLLNLPRKLASSSHANEVLQLARKLGEMHVLDCLSEEEARSVAPIVERSWPGVVARMLLAPAWRLEPVPLLCEVPESLWGPYATWLFKLPVRPLTTSETDALVRHLCRHTEELARWNERNRGSASVREAVEAYMPQSALPFAGRASTAFRRLAQARARILARNWPASVKSPSPVVVARSGRQLRVALVCRDLEVTAESLAWFARIESLDPAGFSVSLFTFQDSDSGLARRCRRRMTEVCLLPPQFETQVEVLHKGAFDVLVFAGLLGDMPDDFCRLALHRLAPLQVTLDSSGLTSGFPTIDLAVADAADAPENFSERVGVAAGARQAFAVSLSETEEEPIFERAALGVPEDAVVLASVIGNGGVGAHTAVAWAQLLATAPRAHLLVYCAGKGPQNSALVSHFSADLQAALAHAGVAAERVSVFASDEPSHAEARGLLRLAQIYLAPLGIAEAAWVAELLAAGVPAVVCEPVAGASDAATLLRAAGASNLVAVDEAAYLAGAVSLATDESFRTETAARIAGAVEQGVEFMDTLGASDAFGHLLEAAFDELGALGENSFRAEKGSVGAAAPNVDAAALDAAAASLDQGDLQTAGIRVQTALRSSPRDPRVRLLHARLLLAEGQPARAVDYLLMLTQQSPGEASLWLTLATALRGNGQKADAIRALENCLRLDGSRVDGWLMMLEVATESGAFDIARDVLEALRALAPDHPDLETWSARLAS